MDQAPTPAPAPAPAPSSTRAWIFGILAVLCCICLMIVGLGAYFYNYLVQNPSAIYKLPVPPNVSSPTPAVLVTRVPVQSIPADTVNTLEQAVVPNHDLYSLACRLKNICNVPTTQPAPASPLQVGAKQQFWVSNVDTNSNFKVPMTLLYITPHSYFWAQDGLSVNQSDMKKLMDTFENKIYPTDRQFFGSEWTPGVDNDPHIYILYTRGTGPSDAGYFASQDEASPLVFKYSDAHEEFVFNADNMDLGSQETYSVLAHEFQHMIHWKLDLNEDTWMNEGFSMLAEHLNGYPPGFDYDYIQNPDLNLTDWLPNLSDDAPHYGEAFLFLDYFLDRFGSQATQALVKDQANGLPSVDDTLKTLNITDPQTGKLITADDVVLDWMSAMYLRDGSVGDGRYTYHNYPDAPQARAQHTLSSCPQGPLSLSVNQYGAEYIDISCAGSYTLSFKGSTVTNLLPTDPHSGSYAFWSNRGDESDMTLTHSFDLTAVSGPVQISYWTWYDLEKGYDYAYLEASTDGQSWHILNTPSCFNQDTSGNAYGCGYTGMSGGGDQAVWLNEQVDLSAYAGKQVQLRFEYVTDPAVNGQGMLLDDISIDAIHYSTDFESDDGGWQSAGFARIENVLPQTFRLALIFKGSKTTVQDITLTADQTADIPLSLTQGQEAILVVTGTQRFTRLPAGFAIEIK